MYQLILESAKADYFMRKTSNNHDDKTYYQGRYLALREVITTASFAGNKEAGKAHKELNDYEATFDAQSVAA